MRNAARYEELAAFARARGYGRCTAATVQGWVKAGLLPRTKWEPWGFQRRSATCPAATGSQLLALCGHRYEEGVRRHHDLAIRLWLDGYALDPSVVRGALFHVADFGREARAGHVLATQRGETATSTEEQVETFAAAALTGPQAREVFGLHGARATLAADALTGLIGHALGFSATPEPDGIHVLGRAIGVTPYGATQLEGVFARWNPTTVKAALERATASELEAARRAAVRAAEVLLQSPDAPPVAQMLSRTLAALFATVFVVFREEPSARAALGANAPEAASIAGASALRYLQTSPRARKRQR